MVARSQSEHERINSKEYPGTRQLCVKCDNPTERCEDDAIYTEGEYGPLCIDCYTEYGNHHREVMCPFCWATGFDQIGLKHHFVMGWCEVYNETASM